MFKKALCAILIALTTSFSWGQGIVDEYVSGNTLNLNIDFNGSIKAEVGVSFENVNGLDAGALGITVQQVDPADVLLAARLPAGGLVTIPTAFPVLLSIAPDPDGDLMIRGTASVSFHTHNLPYAPGTPLRLYKAEHGGNFFDITERTSSGSYRVRGSGGEFSEFMIVADLRPTATAVLDKFNRLTSLLNTHQASIDPALHSSLTALVTGALSNFNLNGFTDAIETLSEFDTTIKKSKGGEMPDAWRPRGDMVNVAGQLRATSGTLRYSLSLLSNGL